MNENGFSESLFIQITYACNFKLEVIYANSAIIYSLRKDRIHQYYVIYPAKSRRSLRGRATILEPNLRGNLNKSFTNHNFVHKQ